MNYNRLIVEGTQALLFTWNSNFLITKEGYVDQPSCLYFYQVDHVKERVDHYKTRQISKKPGVLHNRAVWYIWDGTEKNKKELAEQATKVFIAHYNDKIHKLEKDLDDYLCNEKKLKDILRDIQEENNECKTES